jgi:molybdenum-dependent DNA-binding transcriptional regulator ModE
MPVLAGRPDAHRGRPVMRFVGNDRRNVLFHRLTLPERVQPCRGRVGADGMEMHQVQYFLALCEERNFTRAAKRCGVSQPSLTNAIKRLEQTLGGPLFHRDRRNIELTELGRLVKPYLKQLNQSAYEAKRKAAKVLSAPSITHQPRAMEAFMRAHHVIAVVAVLVIGLGAKQVVFPPQQADADINAVPSASVNVHQMLIDHPNRNKFPAQKMHDMTFVFSAPD